MIFDYIQGEKFKNLADNKKIFYRHTHDVNNFFKNEAPSNDFILISHNSDGGIYNYENRWFDCNSNLCTNNLKKWFGQNVLFEHKKIQSLPIGLENSEWVLRDNKIEKIKNIFNIEKNIKNLIYLNLNIETNPQERIPPYAILKDKKYVTLEHGKNGQNFDSYLNNIYNHCFVICAPGNGFDTHRLWETLYCNTIPIHKRSINTSYYDDLPICFIDEWEQLSDENFLMKEYARIISTQYNKEKLNFNYWKTLILNEANKV